MEAMCHDDFRLDDYGQGQEAMARVQLQRAYPEYFRGREPSDSPNRGLIFRHLTTLLNQGGSALHSVVNRD